MDEASRSEHAAKLAARGPTELTDVPQAMLDVTFNQLRTLVAVRKLGSPRKAALHLHRDQSSVVKQLKALNEHFERICGEPLAISNERGQDYDFTETCDKVVDLSEDLLTKWAATFAERRRNLGRRLIIATTTFTLEILAKVWIEVQNRKTRDSKLSVRQLRTADFFPELDKRTVDVVIGGVVTARGGSIGNEYDFCEWHRGGFSLLTNLTNEQFPAQTIQPSDLRKYCVILPTGGVIIDAIRGWYGDDYEDKLPLRSTVADVHYALRLLRLGILQGFMVATKGLAAREAKRTAKDETPFREIELGPRFPRLEIVSGLCGRPGERKRYEDQDREHPLALFWRIFERQAKDQGSERHHENS